MYVCSVTEFQTGLFLCLGIISYSISFNIFRLLCLYRQKITYKEENLGYLLTVLVWQVCEYLTMWGDHRIIY